MLVNTTTGEMFHVTWQYHERFGEPFNTCCIISKFNPVDKSREEIVRGTASCSYKDQFNKNTGRKLSLSRALITERPTVFEPTKETPQVWGPVFDRSVRKLFWDAYFKMRGKLE